MSNPLDGLTEKSLRTIEFLIKQGIVPATRINFDITEHMLENAVRIYGQMGDGNGRFNYHFARKMHGLNLLLLKFSRGSKLKDCKEGLVYLIANPAWADYLKIGMTIDLNARIKSYQTYDPFQRFYVKNYEFCIDRRAAEKELLEKFNFHLSSGEWIKYRYSNELISVLRRY